MKRIIGLALAAGLALPLAAEAQPRQGVYIGMGGGVNFHEDADIDGTRLTGEAEFDVGFALQGVVGFAFNGPRLEGELSYRQNDTDSSAATNLGGTAINTTPDGDITTLAGMVNLYYDIGTGTIVTPYLGAGIGGAYAEHDDIGDEVVFAYQGIAGLSVNLGDNIDGFADYRYFATTQIEGGDIGRAADIENANHTLMVGLRYYFAPPAAMSPPQASYTPPPPAPPPPPIVRPAAPPRPVFQAPPRPAPVVAQPAPAAMRNYMVFFDFDSVCIRSDAASTIREAADAARGGSVSRIEVTGHADRAGSSRYNKALARRRAEAVRRQLVANGVPSSDIVVASRGERQNLTQTRDGVREQQNRRVEIILN